MTRQRTILIIDDDPDFCRSAEALFRGAGYAVRREAGGPAGLRTARELLPDLVLLDVMMAERTEGFFILQELRRVSALKETPVIVVSSIYSEHPLFRISPGAGWLPADLFLPKPVEPGRLLDEAARLIGRVSPAPAETVAAGKP